jgi:hypothetical protein
MWSAGRVVHRLGLVASALLLLGSAALTARADQGVAVDLGRIAVDEELSKGGTYQLPVMGVSNPGTETTGYRMGVSYFEGQAEEEPPEDWFTFSPAEFELGPGKTQPVTVSLRIPPGARPADYLALLHSSIAPSGEGAQIGAAAGARLTFTVKPSTLLEAWTLRTRGEFDDLKPWSYLVPAALAVLAAATWTRRRFSFNVSRRA